MCPHRAHRFGPAHIRLLCSKSTLFGFLFVYPSCRAPQQVVPKTMHINRWVTLSASALLQCSAGVSYCFSIYSGQLKDALGYNQAQIQGLASPLVALLVVGWLPGFAYDSLRSYRHLGPRHVLRDAGTDSCHCLALACQAPYITVLSHISETETNHELHGSCTRSISAPSILRTAAFLPTGGRVPHYCLSAQCFPWLREQENWQASASHWTCEAYVWMLQIMLCCHIGP